MSKHEVIDIIVKQSPHLSWIKNGTIFLSKHGSHAYGTNIATSDIDLRGVCCPPKEYFFSYTKRFEQAELKAPHPDTTIFDIRKFFNLASQCNPNALEILFTEPEDHILVSPLGQKLLDNRNLFLSNRAKHTFIGYAFQQLKRIKTHRQWLLNAPTHYPTRTELGLPEHTIIPQDQLNAAFTAIQHELDHIHFDFMNNLDEATKIEVVSNMKTILMEMKIYSDEQFVAMGRKIGLSENFIEILKKERQYSLAKREWDQYQNWKTNRNADRSELESKYGYDCKHAMHLVRLIRSCKELLTTGKLNVKRHDKDELLAIRNGAWTYDQLLEYANTSSEEINILYNTTNVLPHIPNVNKLDNLCIELIEESLR